MNQEAFQLLNKIDYPADLRQLPPEKLEEVCSELREFIIDAVSCNPGHFGASLGVVELTVALHYVFKTPHDKLIWDVGHQAYGHKILTGRRKQFHTNRKYKGLSGFPQIEESEYDSFGVGHSSTSISAALGMAIAAQTRGEERNVVAIIGDGSMTGGEAFEGLNNLSATQANVLIVLNDNNMAIDPNIGGLSDYLVDIATSRTYNKIRQEAINTFDKLKITGPRSKDMMVKVNNAIKSILAKQSNIFEGLNIRYFGPVDGHDIERLTQVLQDLKNIPGPKVLHCITKKGKGFKLAEQNQTEWHATGVNFDKNTGEKFFTEQELKPKPPKYQDVFGHSLLELAKENDKIMGITPAMPSGCSLNIMMEAMPHRAFDVGIAEQHAVTFAAGLAISGMVPFCNIYSTFLQRGYDQVIHDVALQKLNVVLCLDRGGLVGADGATHHGAYDLAFLRCIPNLIISAPMDEVELRNLMYTAQLPNKGPFTIRYPRGNGFNFNWRQPFEEIEVGKGRCIKSGDELALISIGTIGHKAQLAAIEMAREGISIAHYDMRFLKPIDKALLHEILSKFKNIITIEDGTIVGGLGSAVLEFAADHGYSPKVNRLGIPDRFVDHGTQSELLRECEYDKAGIVKAIKKMLNITV
ncbi:MAG: 1-deoxy-D-xylulose-5-phosphate synthase [Breznakibacter sp.]|nr:1-deoxy-D-xylulose-5-phosphate synthase [Breznakibacter sp.]